MVSIADSGKHEKLRRIDCSSALGPITSTILDQKAGPFNIRTFILSLMLNDLALRCIQSRLVKIETRMISLSAKTRFVSPFDSTYSTPTARSPSKIMHVTKTFDVTFKLDLKMKRRNKLVWHYHTQLQKKHLMCFVIPDLKKSANVSSLCVNVILKP